MSSQRQTATLADWGGGVTDDDPDATPEPEPAQRPAWAPDDEPEHARVCLGCENHVSTEFARVMGDNDQNVHACPKCANQGELARGAAADPHYEHRTDNGQGAWR